VTAAAAVRTGSANDPANTARRRLRGLAVAACAASTPTRTAAGAPRWRVV
jgi:hypothetical protein